MVKICFVTAARSEYGLLKWIMQDVANMSNVQMQLIVTGAHLLKEQGYTVEQIVEDGFVIDRQIHIDMDLSSVKGIAKSMGIIGQKMVDALDELKPDFIVVLGDRYELLPICNAAFVMRIPIIHISGGDVTEGAIDDGVRNAITMLATYHFPSTIESMDNIVRMRNSKENVWAVGEPGLDAFNRMQLLSRQELASILDLDINKQWILFTYHAETTKDLEYNLATVQNCMQSIAKYKDMQVVCTYANADFGGKQINEYLEDVSKNNENIITVPSLGQLKYLSLMKQVKFVMGNSSSGIVEAPFLSIPVINIGERQKGRYQCANVYQCGNTEQEMDYAINTVLNRTVDGEDLFFWGDGHTSERIISIIHKIILGDC